MEGTVDILDVNEEWLRKIRDSLSKAEPLHGQVIRGFDENGYFEYTHERKPKKFQRYKRKQKEVRT